MNSNQENKEETAIYWTFGNAAFDEARRQLKVDNKLIEIEQRPLDVLAYLLRHAGEVVTKQELMEAAWPGMVVVDNALTNAIGKLRKALGDDGNKIIATQHRVGYRLYASVRRKTIAAIAPESQLKAGDRVLGREHWALSENLSRSERAEVWLAQHAKTGEQRVFKFSLDGTRLASLKREVTIYRLLKDALGERDDFVRILDWNFDLAPYYLECEYVGPNLVSWAEQQGGLDQVSLDERIAIIAQVAETVGEAHRIGVLHKDLKPSNILMFHDGKSWRPKVADFGSGRLLDPDQLAGLGVTQLGFTVTQAFGSASDSGTPLYLAPEILNGSGPSTASDIYALGVMLFQLATGDLTATLAPGWEARIEDPILKQDIAQAAQIDVAHRTPSAVALAQALANRVSRRRELVAAEQRQQQAEQLERQLERVRARRPLQFGLVGVLTVAVAVTSWLYVDAANSRDSAELNARISRKVSEFLNDDLLALVSPLRGGRADISLIEAVDIAAAKIPNRFASEPLARSEIQRNLSAAYVRASKFDAALNLAAEAVATLETSVGTNDLRTVKAKLDLARSHTARSEFEQAEAILDGLNQDAVQQDAEVHVLFLLNRSHLHSLRHEYDPALELAQRAQMRLGGMDQPSPGLVAFADTRLASVLSRVGRNDEAIELLRRMAEDARQEFGDLHARTLDLRFQLGTSLTTADRQDEAVPILEDTLTKQGEVIGTESEGYGDTANMLAYAYGGLELWDKAIAVIEPVHQQLTRDRGSDDFQTLWAFLSLIEAKAETGNYAWVLQHVDSGISDSSKTNGAEHPLTLLLRLHRATAQAQLAPQVDLTAELDALAAYTDKMQAAGVSTWEADINAVRAYQPPN